MGIYYKYFNEAEYFELINFIYKGINTYKPRIYIKEIKSNKEGN